MGPLSGLKVLEIASIGPGPFCAMMLSDLGAEVIRIDRPDVKGTGDSATVLNRGRKSLTLNLKSEAGIAVLLRLMASADMLIEGFRPGVMERLGVGPSVCLEKNPRLIYGRMTGWGQTGPLATVAGHDINYIALSGALYAMGDSDRAPTPPLNLVGDFGGGAMYLFGGLLAAYIEMMKSGKGQVVDAAMVDGSASLTAAFHGLKALGRWSDARGSNYLDGGAHYYGCYACSDDQFIAIGSIESRFYRLLLDKCGISDPEFETQNDPQSWPELKQKLAAMFRTRSREQWCQILEGSDACFAPVLSMGEALHHPHNVARSTFEEVQGVTQPAPAPRFSRTPGSIKGPAAIAGEHSQEILFAWGFDKSEIARLAQENII